MNRHLAISPVGLLTNSVMLEVEDVDVDIFTGVYSSETGRPQPLRITVRAWLDVAAPDRFTADHPLDTSIDYMRLKDAIGALPGNRHFVLIEAVADELIAAIFGIDARIAMFEVRVVKLALSDGKQKIGVRVRRTRDVL
jgi:dihydroneopterin aldolase